VLIPGLQSKIFTFQEIRRAETESNATTTTLVLSKIQTELAGIESVHSQLFNLDNSVITLLLSPSIPVGPTNSMPPSNNRQQQQQQQQQHSQSNRQTRFWSQKNRKCRVP